MHYWVSHSLPIKVKMQNYSQLWDTSLSYEIDNKSLKYMSRERALVLRAAPEGSNWSFKAESTFRKNVVDQYASRRRIIHDSLASVKNAFGI